MYFFIYFKRSCLFYKCGVTVEMKHHLENLILGNMYFLNAKLNGIKGQIVFLKF